MKKIKKITPAVQPPVQDIVAEQEAKEEKANNHNHIVINDLETDKAKWYVVHTYSGHELKVAQALKQRAESMNLTDYIRTVNPHSK